MATPANDTPPNTPQALLGALRRLLKPLVRLLVHFGIGFPYLGQLLKSIYVEVADEEFSAANQKRQSDSRISLITGVHRKDVKRLRNEPKEATKPTKNLSLGAQLVAYWIGNDNYLDDNGEALKLPRFSKEGSSVSFESLVQAVSKGDLRPKVILDELLRLNIVTVDNSGYVSLDQQAFIPNQGLDEKSFYFGKNIHDHIAASVDNLIACDQKLPAPFIDRCVYYDGLSPQSMDTLNTLAKEQGMVLLKEINHRALALQQADAGKNNANQRINLGIYFYHDDEHSKISEQNDGGTEQ